MLPLQVVAAPDASVPEHDQVPAAFAVNWKVVPWFTAGGTEGVITTCPDTGPAGAIVMLDNFCAVCPVESVSTIVNADMPASVGVPAMAPDEAPRFRPTGSAPVTVQAYGVTPPLPMSTAWKGVPTWPLGNPPAVICRAGTVGAELGVNAIVVLDATSPRYWTRR